RGSFWFGRFSCREGNGAQLATGLANPARRSAARGGRPVSALRAVRRRALLPGRFSDRGGGPRQPLLGSLLLHPRTQDGAAISLVIRAPRAVRMAREITRRRPSMLQLIRPLYRPEGVLMKRLINPIILTAVLALGAGAVKAQDIPIAVVGPITGS